MILIIFFVAFSGTFLLIHILFLAHIKLKFHFVFVLLLIVMSFAFTFIFALDKIWFIYWSFFMIFLTIVFLFGLMQIFTLMLFKNVSIIFISGIL
jgi:hypothetical protein